MQTRYLGETTFVARNQLEPVRDGCGADHKIVGADRSPFGGKLSPQLGVDSSRSQVERKNGPGFDKPFDEGFPLRTDSTLGRSMNSVEEFGSRDSGDSDICVGDLRRQTFQIE